MMEPKINQLIHADDEALDVYMAFVLLWIAAADGALNREVLAYLYHNHESLPKALDRADKLLAIIAADDMGSFLQACRGLQRQLPMDSRATFLRIAIATAVAAGGLSIAANHTLRFLADLLNCESDEFAAAYREHAQQDLPEPGDPGSIQWWKSKENKPSEEDTLAPPGLPTNRSEALTVLGLAGEASGQSIKQAYRRLVQSHHPDRVAGLDSSSRQAAQHRFLQVQQAYELLRK